MKLLPLERLGPHEVQPGLVEFGIFLPWISPSDGNRLAIKLIHEQDQFLQHVAPREFPLSHETDPEYGDYWFTRVAISPDSDGSHWGQTGRYVYRYQLYSALQSEPVDWIIDPFAREFGVGKLSAFTLGYKQYEWSDSESGWRTPPLHDLVMYELMITEFGGDIPGTIARLDYLADMGINALEIMPVSNVANTVDWGFLPIGYFGVDERFGKRRDFQWLVDEAHRRGIAVILDSVYGHTSDQFPYSYLYRTLNYHQNPFMGDFAKNYFGQSTDWSRSLTQDFFFTVNHHWLEVYHVDGFRYDCVPNYWDGPVGEGYSRIVYETYQHVKALSNQVNWQRFQNGNRLNLIQCAEQLEGPVEILEKTYSNSAWQDETLGAARAVAGGDFHRIADFALRIGSAGYPRETTANGDTLEKMPLQYIETHDHERFICNFGRLFRDNDLLSEGERSHWFKVQPYLIALLTGTGIPMLWQGQELGENYFIPDQGWGRVMLFRPMRWDFFYDPIGKSLSSLVRKLVGIRRNRQEFRTGAHYFYNHYDNYQSKGIMLFSRSDAQAFSLVAVNFSDQEQQVPFSVPLAGRYEELLCGNDMFQCNKNQEQTVLRIPSNYGRIWRHTGS